VPQTPGPVPSEAGLWRAGGSESLRLPALAAQTRQNSDLTSFTVRVKEVPRISTKNQITIPVAALEEAGLRPGEAITVEPAGDGELRLRRSVMTFEGALGSLTGTYPAGYLDTLDAEDDER
jgi:antitoxin component of MazEF toxin-antitoxin module